MNFLIVGAGSVGLSLAEKLTQINHRVTLVDEQDSALEYAANELDIRVLLGNGSSPEVLNNAGIENTDYVIAVTDNDQVNISVCLLSKLINPKAQRIARIRDINFTHPSINTEELKSYFDLIINPPRVTAEYLAKLINMRGAHDVISFADDQLIVTALEVTPDAEIANKKISSLVDIRLKIPIFLTAIVRDEKLIVPRGTDRILPGDLLYCQTYPKYLNEVIKLSGQVVHHMKNIMITGNTQLARALTQILEEQNKNVKLILPNNDKSDKYLEDFDSTLIIKGESSDSKLLLEENIEDVDAFLALGESEEQNIMSALLAKKLGATLTVALINNREYLKIVREIGIDASVNSQVTAANAIVRHLYSGKFLSATHLSHTDANFIEVIIEKNHSFINKTIMELDLPYGILISAIIRNGKATIPTGADQLLLADRVIIFYAKSAQKKLQKMLDLPLDLFN